MAFLPLDSDRMAPVDAVPPIRAYRPERPSPGRPGTDRPEIDTTLKPDDPLGEADILVCAVCRSFVTRRRWAIPVDGDHEHLFVNPAGVAFEIGCYRDAPGARPRGPAVLEATWFPGFAWRIALCGHCAAHLGWRYEPAGSAGSGFFGLIRKALAPGGGGA